MIITLNGADFSTQNIGEIELPRELNAFTLAAITASGNSGMTNAQKLALDIFFEKIGAFGSLSQIWGKLDKVYLPFIASSVANAVVNYKASTPAADATPNSTYWQLTEKGGLRPIGSVAAANGLSIANYVLDYQSFSLTLLNTEEMPNSMYGNNVPQVAISTGADSQLNSYKTFGFGVTSSTTGAKGILARFKLSSGANSVYKGITDSLDDHSVGTRVLSSNETNVYALTKGSSSVQTDTWPSGASDVRDTTAHNLYLCCNSTTATADSANKVGHGAIIIGGYLTSEEMVVMRDALDAVYRIFYPSE